MLKIYYNDILSQISKIKVNTTSNLIFNPFSYRTKKYKAYIDGLADSQALIISNFDLFQRSNSLEPEDINSFYFKCKSELYLLDYNYLNTTKKYICYFPSRKYLGYHAAIKRVIRIMTKQYKRLQND